MKTIRGDSLNFPALFVQSKSESSIQFTVRNLKYDPIGSRLAISDTKNQHAQNYTIMKPLNLARPIFTFRCNRGFLGVISVQNASRYQKRCFTEQPCTEFRK